MTIKTKIKELEYKGHTIKVISKGYAQTVQIDNDEPQHFCDTDVGAIYYCKKEIDKMVKQGLTNLTPNVIINTDKGKGKVLKMYEYTKGNYVYRGNKECGTPLREVRTVNQQEADYWDRIERRIRQQNRKQGLTNAQPRGIISIEKRKGNRKVKRQKKNESLCTKRKRIFSKILMQRQ